MECKRHPDTDTPPDIPLPAWQCQPDILPPAWRHHEEIIPDRATGLLVLFFRFAEKTQTKAKLGRN
jgi:hypothetical protein